MPIAKEDYTLWNNPSDRWTKILENVVITSEVERLVLLARQQMDIEQIEEKLKPFKTAVTEKTMSQLIG